MKNKNEISKNYFYFSLLIILNYKLPVMKVSIKIGLPRKGYYAKITNNFCGFFVLLICIIFFNDCTKIENNVQPVSSSNSSSVRASNKPNIIFILADDVGFEIPQYNGGQSYPTPNINSMAAQGIRFTQCYASPLCSPSRFMILTGKYNFRNYGEWGVMDPNTNRTIANMLHDAGYKTLVAGKWQLDGGDTSIHKLGFDDYVVYEPFANIGIAKGSRYKDPTFYRNGALYAVDSLKGKYGEDVLVNYMSNFMDSNKNKPFFIWYTMNLCHYPFCPTPDDPEFAKWDPYTSIPDTMFFPSMVKYMDKKVGQVLDKVKASGLSNNTIVIYVGDNGTDKRVYSYFRNKLIEGGKAKPYATGTQEGMIIWAPGRIAPNQLNTNLIDFTDFLPTIANIARIPKPTTYGTLDGVSFYPNLLGQAGTPRDWVFCHYDQNQGGETRPILRWINNTTYKLFDSTGNFYNIKKDIYETSPIPDSKLTPKERSTKNYFQSVLDTMHK
jgi:arylsulfatase A